MSAEQKHLHPHTTAVAMFAVLATITLTVTLPVLEMVNAQESLAAELLYSQDSDGDGMDDQYDLYPTRRF